MYLIAFQTRSKQMPSARRVRGQALPSLTPAPTHRAALLLQTMPRTAGYPRRLLGQEALPMRHMASPLLVVTLEAPSNGAVAELASMRLPLQQVRLRPVQAPATLPLRLPLLVRPPPVHATTPDELPCHKQSGRMAR